MDQVLNQVTIFDDPTVKISVEENILTEAVQYYISNSLMGRTEVVSLKDLCDEIYVQLTSDADIVGADMAHGDEECDIPLTVAVSNIIKNTIATMAADGKLTNQGDNTFSWSDTGEVNPYITIWEGHDEYYLTRDELSEIIIASIENRLTTGVPFSLDELHDDVNNQMINYYKLDISPGPLDEGIISLIDETLEESVDQDVIVLVDANSNTYQRVRQY